MASIVKERVTAEEFSQLPETNLPTELIDGEIIRMAAPKDLHQKLVGRLHLLLAPKIPGGELRLSPSECVSGRVQHYPAGHLLGERPGQPVQAGRGRLVA